MKHLPIKYLWTHLGIQQEDWWVELQNQTAVQPWTSACPLEVEIYCEEANMPTADPKEMLSSSTDLA